jgi:cob(I)alamin adenosyltransferase
MTQAQRDALDFAVGEVTRPLYDRIAELEADLKDAQEQVAELGKDLAMAEEHNEDEQDMIADAYSRGLTDGAAELEPMRPVQEALHKLLSSDTVQYHAPSNTLHLGRATFAALGDESILRALHAAALAFTGETT